MPLAFNEAEGADHFRTEGASRALPAVHSRKDEFSLQPGLTPSSSSDSSDVEFKEALGVASGRSAFDACKSPPAGVDEGREDLDDSDRSIPSAGINKINRSPPLAF